MRRSCQSNIIYFEASRENVQGQGQSKYFLHKISTLRNLSDLDFITTEDTMFLQEFMIKDTRTHVIPLTLTIFPKKQFFNFKHYDETFCEAKTHTPP